MSSLCHHPDASTDAGAPVVDLVAIRVERIARALEDELRRAGVARVRLADVGDPDTWRRGARAAAKALGWRIRTGTSGEYAWAASADWPSSPDADRRAANLLASLIFDGQS